MVSTIRKNPDRTEKLGITLPISLLHKIDNNNNNEIMPKLNWQLIVLFFPLRLTFSQDCLSIRKCYNYVLPHR